MNRAGPGCLVLSALPFAAVGVGAAIWLAMDIHGYLKSKGWVEVPATILQTRLVEHHGDDSTTYEVTAEYEYVYQDQKYRGRRVSFQTGSDNIGSFHQELHRRLSQCQRTEQPVPCYVNPNRPDQAILVRELRWAMLLFKMLFVVAFGGVGFGLITGGLLSLRKRPKVPRNSQFPATPWKERSDWAAGRIVYSEKGRMVGFVVAAVIWNLAASPIWLAVGDILPRPAGWLGAVIFLGPTVGLLLAYAALLAWRRWRHYGESIFQMASVPGVIGGQIAGVIQTSAKVVPAEGYRVSLRCVRRITTGSGDDRKTTEETVWSDERVVLRELAEGDQYRSAIPVLFGIPYSCRPTDGTDSDDTTSWRLEASARDGRLRYRAAFEVPVFHTEESRPDFVLDESSMAGYAAPRDFRDELKAAGILVSPSPTGRGERFEFPADRSFGIAAGMALFWIAWTIIVVVLYSIPAPTLFVVAFGLADVGILWALIEISLFRSTVDVSREGLSVASGRLWTSSQQIPRDEIERIENVRGMQSNANVYYNIVAVRRGKKRVYLAKRVLGARLAEVVAKRMEAVLEGRETSPSP